jgi:cytosine/adenosine deaminase-related metal-dependent hydrolase
MILRARVVLPLSRPPIDDGAVFISGNRIVRVGRWKDVSRERWSRAVDLGEMLLLPGLVNAHCHLDYTDLAGMVPPQKSFTDWIKLITAAKGQCDDTEFGESWLRGARMLVRTGTTTVGDFEALPKLLPGVWAGTPLRVLSFLELTGVRSRRPPRVILQEALARIRALPGGRCHAVVAPHAPYSTLPELIRLCARASRRRKWPLSIHLSESSQEFEMFLHAHGELFDWLRRNDRDPSDCGRGSPVQHLASAGALSKFLLAVHVNYLAKGDAVLLGRKKVSVVHCPRSHVYFDHAPFPFRELTHARVNVCLGTDSLATVYKRRRETVELNLFEEMRTFAQTHPRISPKLLLHMTTLNGARALGMAGHAGELSPSAFADLIAIPYRGAITGIYEAAVRHRGEVAASMIDGQWAIPPLNIR